MSPMAALRSRNTPGAAGNSPAPPDSITSGVRPKSQAQIETVAITVPMSASTAAEPAATVMRASCGRSAHSNAEPASPIHSRNMEVRARSVQKSMVPLPRARVSTSAVSSTISTVTSVAREVQKSGR